MSFTENNKILLFEYSIHKLMKWYRQAVVNPERTIYGHFTRLTSLKFPNYRHTI